MWHFYHEQRIAAYLSYICLIILMFLVVAYAAASAGLIEPAAFDRHQWQGGPAGLFLP